MDKPNEIVQLEQKLGVEFVVSTEENTRENSVNYSYGVDSFGYVDELRVNFHGKLNLSFLLDFPHLQFLFLQGNGIRSLEPVFYHLKNLTYLDISDNLVDDISVLRYHRSLTVLDLQNNRVFDLSPLYWQVKEQSLKFIYVGDNPLTYPPMKEDEEVMDGMVDWFDKTWNLVRAKIEICKARKTDFLDLGGLAITDLSHFPELFDCIWLKTLILSNEWAVYENGGWLRQVNSNDVYPNNLYTLPKDIRKLINLETLICGGDWQVEGFFRNRWRIRDFGPVAKLEKLKVLNLSNNKIARIGRLNLPKSIETVYLNNNRIHEIDIRRILPNLTELYLSNNLIGGIAFVNLFPKLSTVDLHSNRIRSLLPIKKLIAKVGIVDAKWEIGTVSIANNKKIWPGVEVISQGTKYLLAFFDRYEKENKNKLAPIRNNDIKVIVVGNSNVGKSTLVEWFLTGNFVTGLSSTNWLSTKPLELNESGKKYVIRFFDFGGQEYYHDTHHLFFTSQTVYLLLWDSDSNSFSEQPVSQRQSDGSYSAVIIQNYPLAYWLDAINYYSKRRIFMHNELTMNQVLDQRGAELRNDINSGLRSLSNDDETRRQAPKKNGANILVLQNKVDELLDVTFLDEGKLSDKYKNIANFFRLSVEKQRGLSHLREMLLELIGTIPVYSEEYLSSWGTIKIYIEENLRTFTRELSFKDFKELCNEQIRSMDELAGKDKKQIKALLFNDTDTDSFARYLNVIGLILYFPENENLRDKIFVNQEKVLEQIYNIMLGLGTKNGRFDQEYVCKQLGFDSFTEDCQTILELMESFKIIIPHPYLEKTYLAPLYLPKEPSKSVCLFVSSFMWPLCRFVFKGFVHKGLVLEFFALYGKQVLHEPNRDLYYYWREGVVLKDSSTYELLLIRFVNGNPEKEEAYIEVSAAADPRKSNFAAKVAHSIEDLTKDRNVEKHVSANGKDFVPLWLILENETKRLWTFEHNGLTHRLSDFKFYLKNESSMKNIFISYSKSDLELVNTFIEHLSALKRDGKVANWYCTELVAGRKWERDIQEHFDQSDIICFMVSPNFMKTDYILDHEVKWAFDRQKTDEKFRIVPIIMDFCRWTTKDNNLGDFTALPFTAKPVLDFKNQNMAWYIIVECLSIMIEKDLDPKGDTFYEDRLGKDVKDIYKRLVKGTLNV